MLGLKDRIVSWTYNGGWEGGERLKILSPGLEVEKIDAWVVLIPPVGQGCQRAEVVNKGGKTI